MAKTIQCLYGVLVTLFHSANAVGATNVESIEITHTEYESDRTLVDIKHKRSVYDRNKACDMLISFDEPFWENKERNMTELVRIANHHVQKLNDVFIEQIFIDDYDDLYFRLARVQVCSHVISVTKLNLP